MISEEIKQYLIKVCTILNSHNVDYLVVGGAAVSHYGFSRPFWNGQFNSKAEIINIDGVSLRILSYDDLITNKRTVNWKTDHSDIAELGKIRKGRRRGKGI